MNETEFNLLNEPWICALTLNGNVQKYTLPDVLTHAHELRRLAGEMPAQDFAMLRLLLAVLQTVIYRYNEDGEKDLLEEGDEREILERWKNIWDAGKLPDEILRQYFECWKDHFWLFHPQRPFYQVPEAEKGTGFKAGKLDGSISESNNKSRLFSSKTGAAKGKMEYDEAARWLLYLNGYDDASAKSGAGVGWLGQIGVVFSEGETLFETLMLNLVLLDEQRECWSKPRPTWELEIPESKKSVEIPVPNNQAELLSLQSRRIFLKREEDRVTGYSLLGGDFFNSESAFAEQMTRWQVLQKNKKTAPKMIPRKNNAEKQMWRDFASFVIAEEEDIRPGIVRWIECLKSKGLIDKKRFITFRVIAVKYGNSTNSYIKDVFGDSVGFHIALLTDAGAMWRKYIQEEIQICDIAAQKIVLFVRELQRARGVENAEQISEAKIRFYGCIDIPFRKWLAAIDPTRETSPDRCRAEWRKQAYCIAQKLGKKFLQEAGEEAFIGRKDKNPNANGYYHASPRAYNDFQNQIYNCFHMKEVKEILNGK